MLEIAKLVLEYLKVILTVPVLFSIFAVIFVYKFHEDIKAFLSRVAKIKLPGGTEVSTPQSSRAYYQISYCNCISMGISLSKLFV